MALNNDCLIPPAPLFSNCSAIISMADARAVIFNTDTLVVQNRQLITCNYILIAFTIIVVVTSVVQVVTVLRDKRQTTEAQTHRTDALRLTPDQIAIALATDRLNQLPEIARRMAVVRVGPVALSDDSVQTLHSFDIRYERYVDLMADQKDRNGEIRNEDDRRKLDQDIGKVNALVAEMIAVRRDAADKIRKLKEPSRLTEGQLQEARTTAGEPDRVLVEGTTGAASGSGQ